jgi:hypothetical protein
MIRPGTSKYFAEPSTLTPGTLSRCFATAGSPTKDIDFEDSLSEQF